MIVVDASALAEILLRRPAAGAVESRLFSPGEALHAPHLIDVETAQVLRRYSIMGELTPARGQEALSDLKDFPIRRHPHDLFLQRIWELRGNFTAYDAAYVALAETLDAVLVTRDKRLAAAAKRHVRVALV